MVAELVKWLIVGMYVLGALMTVSKVEKPRKPLAAEAAAGVVAINAVYIVLIAVFWQNG